MQTPVNDNTETKEKKRRGTWLLILLIVFIILFLLSSVILGARLYELATRDKYAVDMTIGSDGELELFKIEYGNETGEITKYEDADSIRAICESTYFAQGSTVFTLLDSCYGVYVYFVDGQPAASTGAFVRGLVPDFIP